MRIKKFEGSVSNTTFLIFSTGRVVCTGAKTIEDNKRASRTLAKGKYRKFIRINSRKSI